MPDKIKKKPIGAAEAERMKLFYDRGESLSEVGERFGMGPSGIKDVFRRHGIQTRKRTASRKFSAAMGSRRIRIEKAVLADLYTEQRLSLRQIAAQLDVSYDTVHRNLLEYEIPVRHLKNYVQTPLTAELLTILYIEENRTVAEIVERLGCSSSTVWRKLAEYKIRKLNRAAASAPGL